MEFAFQPVASFFVGEHGIERIEYGEDAIPKSVAVFDPSLSDVEAVTLASNPIRWAELLPSAYRSGDVQVTVTETDDAQARDSDLVGPITSEMQVLPS